MATTSSGAVTTSTVNGTSRITGLSSGLDVDSIVKGLMDAEKVKLYKMEQQEDLLTWKQEAYRSTMGTMNTFSSTYLDTLASGSITKQGTFLQYEATTSDADSSYVTAAASANAKAGSHTLAVSQLATAHVLESGGAATATALPTYGTTGSWALTVNGISYSVTLSSSMTDLASLQSAVDTAVGSNKLKLGTNSSGYLTVTADSNNVTSYTAGAQSDLGFAASSSVASGTAKSIQGAVAPTYGFSSGTTWKITVDGTSYSVDLSGVTTPGLLQEAVDKAVGSNKLVIGTDSGCLTVVAKDSGVQAITVASQDALGFTSTAVLSNRLNTSSTLTELNSSLKSTSFTFGGTDNDEIAFTINGESFTFDSSDTLSAVISKVNQSDAGVTMSYDSIRDRLVLMSKTMGSGSNLTVSDTEGTFLSTLLNCDLSGQDAKLTLDGQALTRSSNTVTVDGVTYTLKKETTSDVSVGVTQNTTATFDAIVKFVNGYNTLIDTIKGKLDEDYDRNYQPLTDAQKSSMSDSDITAWEKKAKVGLLERDDMLQSFLDELRGAFMASVPGVSLTLKAIGITSSSYSDYGKLTVDESKLKSAIQSDPEGIMNLFSQKSSSYSTSSVRSLSGTEQSVRYKEEGYGMRFYDIFQKYIGTSRDSAGNKGLLVEKAGLADDASSTDNSLSDQLEDMKERITNEEKRLSVVQTRYYSEYTNMETYLNKLTTQMSVFNNNSGG